MPSLEPDTGDMKRVYDEVRAAIKVGERVFKLPSAKITMGRG